MHEGARDARKLNIGDHGSRARSARVHGNEISRHMVVEDMIVEEGGEDVVDMDMVVEEGGEDGGEGGGGTSRARW